MCCACVNVAGSLINPALTQQISFSSAGLWNRTQTDPEFKREAAGFRQISATVSRHTTRCGGPVTGAHSGRYPTHQGAILQSRPSLFCYFASNQKVHSEMRSFGAWFCHKSCNPTSWLNFLQHALFSCF